MRIDLLITELDVGGAESCLAAVAEHLSRQGHAVRFIAIGPPPPADRDRLLRRVRTGGIDVRFLVEEFRGSASATRRRQALRLPRLLRSLIDADRPDVALSFLFHANALAACSYPKRGVPLAMGVRLADPSFLRAAVSRLVHRRASKIICVSEAVADHAIAREAAPPDKTLVIPNGIDVEGWRRAMQATTASLSPNDRPVALYVGRYAQQKRVDWILRLIDDPRFVATGFRVAMVGDGPLAGQVERAAASHPDRLIDLGRRDDVAAQMSFAEFLLLPSRYEGMPNAVLEAMASGLPVAATDAEGVRQLLGESAASQCVRIDDEEAWRKMVLRLAGDAKLRRQLGEANLERCRMSFALGDRLAEYEAVLTQLTG